MHLLKICFTLTASIFIAPPLIAQDIQFISHDRPGPSTISIEVPAGKLLRVHASNVTAYDTSLITPERTIQVRNEQINLRPILKGPMTVRLTTTNRPFASAFIWYTLEDDPDDRFVTLTAGGSMTRHFFDTEDHLFVLSKHFAGGGLQHFHLDPLDPDPHVSHRRVALSESVSIPGPIGFSLWGTSSTGEYLTIMRAPKELRLLPNATVAEVGSGASRISLEFSSDLKNWSTLARVDVSTESTGFYRLSIR